MGLAVPASGIEPKRHALLSERIDDLWIIITVSFPESADPRFLERRGVFLTHNVAAEQK
jgi:hypothetical protein